MSGSVEIVLKKATKLEKTNKPLLALNLVEDALKRFPANPRLKNRHKNLSLEIVKSQADIDPPYQVLKRLTDLMANGNFEEAELATQELLKIHPHSAALLNVLGVCFMEQKDRIEDAKALFLRAANIKPNWPATNLNLGNLYRINGDIEKSLGILRASVKAGIDEPDIFNSLGVSLQCVLADDEAKKCFLRALQLDPSHIDARNNLGYLAFKEHDFAKSWRLREARFDKFKYKDELKRFKNSQWNKTKTDTLLVWAEQGIGDEIMFASVLKELLGFSDELVVSVSSKLVDIFKRSFGSNIKFIDRNTNISNESFENHVSAMTALGYFRNELGDFEKARKPYLLSDATRGSSILSELEHMAKDRPIVGLSWFSEAQIVGEARSIDLVELVKEIPDDLFLVSLQYGATADDLKRVRKELGRDIYQLPSLDYFNDLDGLAALISVCNRVVSVDNVIVHLAGALGKRCDILLPYFADWRWGEEKATSSLWYEGQTLHRQKKRSVWGDCTTSVRLSLEA
jgi:tetratricopeptide (TPR) repeat protein